MTEHQTFEFNPASLQELADVVECDLAFIRKRNAELMQQQVVFLDALNKLTIGRQEQSRKILELRAEIDTLTAQAKESHEQGYDVICSKDEEITELKKERAKCQEELEGLKWSMGLLRFPVLEPVPDTFELRIKMILNEIREMKEHLAISNMCIIGAKM